MNINAAQVINMAIVRAESYLLAMFFGTYVQIVIFIVLLTDGAERVFGVGPRKDLNADMSTSWLCFSRESRICFW